MRKLTRKSLDELAKVMPVLDESTKRIYIGGCKPSCVFNCFDYLDGDLYDSCHYYEYTSGNLGYEPRNDGGVPTSDIPAIGSFGGFHVQELTSGVALKKDGTTNGCNVMMTFNDGNIDHAVIVNGYEYDESGNLMIKYHDPTTGTDGKRADGNYSALYSVAPLYVDSPITGTIDNESGSIVNSNYA